MLRRRFLAAVGAATVAGCTGEAGSDAEPPSTNDATPTETTTQEPTATETATATETDGPTKQTETTPSRAAELIAEARTHLRTAVEAFTAEADAANPTLTDVTAATADFSRFDVHDAYDRATRDLQNAKNSASESEAAEADHLLAVAEYIETLGFAQIHLVNAYDEVRTARRNLFHEKYGSLSGGGRAIQRQRDSAADYVTSIRDGYETKTFDDFEPISGEQFRAKLEQMDRELAAFEVIATEVAQFETPMERFESDVADYTAKRYDGVTFFTHDFEDIATSLEEVEHPGSVEPIFEDLLCVLEAIIDGSRVMQQAVLARKDEDHSTARSYEEEAETAFDSCEIATAEIRSVQDLMSAIPQ